MQEVVNTNAGNQIVYKEYEDGVKYALYVPENVNEDTPVFTYVYGSGGKPDWYSKLGSYGPYDSVIENESDSIIIMPEMSWSANWGEKTMDIVNSVKEEYGITNNNVSSSGFSMGGFAGYVTVAENLKQNGASNLSPQVVYYIDDYSNKTYYNYKTALTDEAIDLFKENGTIFFAYEGDNKWNGSDATDAYAAAGLNVIRVQCEDGGHMAIKNNFFKNQVYEYMAGGTLPQEGYKYQQYIYDEESGKWNWVDIDYESVATLENLYGYLGLESVNSLSKIEKLMNLEDLVLKSDDKVLESYLNGIRSSIKSTKMLSSSSIGGFSSTTMMPSGVPKVVTTYMSATVNLLTKLANETNQFARIGESINETNFNLERKVEEIEEPIELEEMEEASKKDETTTITIVPIVPEKQESTEEKESPEEQVIKEETNNKEPIVEDDTASNKTPTYSRPTSSNSSNGSSQNTSNPTTETKTEIEPSEALQEFPEYANVISDDNKFVFQNDQGYKLVIHKDGNIINGVEHYYDFGSQENALNTIESIKTAYKGNEYLEQIIQDGQYIKVIFTSDVYKNYDINTIVNLYENLEGYKKI